MQEARRRAAIAVRFTDDLIGLVEACGPTMIEARHMDAVIDNLIRIESEMAEALREACEPRSMEAVTAAIHVQEATRETLRAALVYNVYDALNAPLDRVFRRLGLSIDQSDEDFPSLARRAARAMLEVAEENIRREQGI